MSLSPGPSVPPGLEMGSEKPNMSLQGQAYSWVPPTEATMLSWPLLGKGSAQGLTQTVSGQGCFVD